MINIMYENENIDGSPFTVRVYDPGRVKVFGLQDGGDTGGPIQFTGEFTRAPGSHRHRPTSRVFVCVHL